MAPPSGPDNRSGLLGSSPPVKATQIELLADLACAGIYSDLEGEKLTPELMAAALRTAYANGYCDALRDEPPVAVGRELAGALWASLPVL